MISTDITRAADLLRAGGVVAIPTETVYGLGCHARDVQAVSRVFEIKGRPRFDPLIVHVAALSQARALVRHWPQAAEQLAEHFWPGPLTLVLPKQEDVPDIVTAGLDSVAIRIPAHAVARELLAEVGLPIAAPSANRFGRISPTASEHVREELGDAVDLILEGGRCPTGIESTVISLLDDKPLLLRPGGTAVEEIEQVVGPVQRPAEHAERSSSPGRLPSHYAPATPLILAPPAEAPSGRGVGLLAFTAPPPDRTYGEIRILSPSGDLREAAANVFAAMRELDAAGLDQIVAEPVPAQGLGLAINDRLHRAAAARQTQ